jgi:hypothetical protein
MRGGLVHVDADGERMCSYADDNCGTDESGS